MGSSWLTARDIRALPGFVFVGAVASLGVGFLSNRIGHPAAVVTFLLLAPLCVFVLPFAFLQMVKKINVLARQLTWWHGLWLLVFSSSLVFRMRDLAAIRETAVDAWAVYRITLVCVTALFLAARLALRQTEWLGSLFKGLVGTLAIYSLVSVVSTLWSVYPAWTLYKGLE